MKYTANFDVYTFPFWGPAKEVIDQDIAPCCKMEELGNLIEENFADEIPTMTQINDFVWFERGYILKQLGIDDN